MTNHLKEKTMHNHIVLQTPVETIKREITEILQDF